MRIVIFILLHALLAQAAISQDEKIPLQKELQAQMAEAKIDAKKQITELEKDIAAAKINKEDPETIKEMEDQLATLKQMLGMLDKAGSLNKKPETPATIKTVLPKYISPIIHISLKQPVIGPTEKQAKDTLLWYAGKKIDDSTLVTTTGMVVRYSSKRNMIILQPDEKKDTMSFMQLAKTLAQTETYKNNYVVTMDGIKNSSFMFPEILKAYQEYDLLRDRYYDMAKNTIDLTPIDDLFTDSKLNSMYDQLVQSLEQLKALIRSLDINTITPESLETPPERPNNLCACDNKQRDDFEGKVRKWPHKFYKEEYQLWSMICKMEGEMETYSDRGGFGNGRGQVPNWRAGISEAQSLFIKRQSYKLFLLTGDYQMGNVNIYKEDGLVEATAVFATNLSNLKHIPGVDALKAEGDTRIKAVRDLVVNDKLFEDYIEDQKTHNNYNVVFDYSLYASHELNKKMLDPDYDLSKNLFAKWIDGLQNFNRFELTINMEFTYELVDKTTDNDRLIMTADGKLETGKIIVSLGRNINECKWNLRITDANYRDKGGKEKPFYLPIEVKQGTKIFHLPEKQKSLKYHEPKFMNMVFPVFRISFCQDGGGGEIKDSAYMNVLRYSDPDLKAYLKDHPEPNFDKEYSIDMLAYANKLFLGIRNTQINTNKIVHDVGDMVAIYLGETPKLPSTGNATLDKLMMENFMSQQKEEAQIDLSRTTHTNNTVIPFEARNGESDFTPPPFNTVDPNDADEKFGIKLTKGKITLEIKHTPR